ncbi:MAG: hypothetical protein EZS28_014039 [Streblomastix strix]|uniref:Uncharacterized protein n=1 Tax=Streblomastix strix TaxID=222440 RepID=A0A5J4W683_9EUKA|nr:MAG: hypothetical protein EZS28_014039 [Streblomastix strix]
MIYEIMSTIIVLGKVVCTLLILESKRRNLWGKDINPYWRYGRFRRKGEQQMPDNENDNKQNNVSSSSQLQSHSQQGNQGQRSAQILPVIDEDEEEDESPTVNRRNQYQQKQQNSISQPLNQELDQKQYEEQMKKRQQATKLKMIEDAKIQKLEKRAKISFWVVAVLAVLAFILVQAANPLASSMTTTARRRLLDLPMRQLAWIILMGIIAGIYVVMMGIEIVSEWIIEEQLKNKNIKGQQMHLSLADIRIAEYLLRELGGFSWFNCGQLSGAR